MFCNEMRIRILSIIVSAVVCFATCNCCLPSDGLTIAKKLKMMEDALPLPYHDALPDIVKRCAAEPVAFDFESFGPFVEAELSSRGMPLEMKYLPLALSRMRGDYRDGDRCGVWALPTLVGLRYGLRIEADYDERLSVEAATRAALDYIAELNAKYDNWWLSILAYTNSPNALHHALMRSDKVLELWDFHEQALLPDVAVIGNFIAYVYLGAEGQLRFEEPAIAVSPEIRKTVSEQPTALASEPKKEPVATPAPKPQPKSVTYTVKKGDTLGKIAGKYHVSVANLKKWNHLKSDMIREGQKLIIKS